MKTILSILLLFTLTSCQIEMHDDFGTPYYDYSPLHSIARKCVGIGMDYKMDMSPPDHYSISCFPKN